MSNDLNIRAVNHDKSKWSPEEWPLFESSSHKLASMTYGSEEKKEITKVEVKVVSNRLIIYLDGMLNLSIGTKELIGIQFFTHKDDKWHIDFITKSNKFGCWYTDKEIWQNIVTEIKKLDLF